MIYEKYNFSDTYSNASGNRKDAMLLGELGKVISENKESVISALKDADVVVPRNIGKKGLIRLILANKRNTRMINNLAMLIFASVSISKAEFSNVDGQQKGEFFKKIGDWFRAGKERRQARRQARQGKKGQFGSKVGSFFKNNSDVIGDISGDLIDGLGNRQAQNSIYQNTQNRYRRPQEEVKKSFFEKNKTAIIVGSIAVVIVGGILIFKRRS